MQIDRYDTVTFLQLLVKAMSYIPPPNPIKRAGQKDREKEICPT